MEKSKKKKIYKKIDMVSFYKSIVDQDRASVVICNLKHEIIYMNPAAVISYAKRGGDKLIGRSLLDCYNPESKDKIQQVVDWFAVDESHNIVYTFHNEKQNKDVYMVALRDEGKLIGYYEKHEYRNAETMKHKNANKYYTFKIQKNHKFCITRKINEKSNRICICTSWKYRKISKKHSRRVPS